jgi:hypothetical protein
MKDTKISSLLHEYIPTGRRNVGRSKKRWKQTNMKTEQAWNYLYPISAADTDMLDNSSHFTMPYFVKE